MEQPNENMAQTVRDLAHSIRDVINVNDDGQPIAITPPGYQIQELEKYLPIPARIRATVVLATVAGLVAYVERFKTSATSIFAHPDSGKLCAVLDYDMPGDSGASWRTHRAIYSPANSVEWQRWIGKNDQWMPQRDFAEFIENNVEDIVEPSGATMLEIAKTLEARSGVEFKSGVRLDNGTQHLTFVTETTAKAGEKGALDIPPHFKLALVPFIGGQAYPLMARFRYKIAEGKLALRYQLVNPHKLIEAAVLAITEEVQEETGIAPFLGTAP